MVNGNSSIFKINVAPFQSENLTSPQTCKQAENDGEHNDVFGVVYGIDQAYGLVLRKRTVFKDARFGNTDLFCRIMYYHIVLDGIFKYHM